MSRPLLASDVAAYLDGLVPERHPVLQEMEDVAKRTDFPIIGPACGHLCYLLARLIGARHVFELGSGFGYSTAWFARAVKENGGGKVHHVVWDEKLSSRAKDYLGRMELTDVVEFHMGEAVATLREHQGPFDVVFNDIDKEGYPASLGVIVDRVRTGGLLITDNLLWSARILDPADKSAATEGVREITRLVYADRRWIPAIVPLRDGMLVALRNAD
jgi:predicted O-methyltransferase YrrM